MILRHGNMFTEGEPDVILATCNSFVGTTGCVMMGRGAAKLMREVFPGCDKVLGTLIIKQTVARYTDKVGWMGLVYGMDGEQRPSTSVCPAYGVVYTELDDTLTIGLFQVKDHWTNKATLELIASSVDILRKLAKTEWKGKAISLNFPGIGNGQLNRKEVLPLLHRLPDNVTIWEL